MTAGNLLVTGLGKRLGDTQALGDVSLRAQGGVTTILGANGAGKTTLLRCLATAYVADEGEILVDGLNPRHPTDRVEIRRRIGYQPQTMNAYGRSRVYDVLDYLAVLKELGTDRQRRAHVFGALEQVGLADRASDRVATLSGGMVQRMGVAAALMGYPRLLILDEPAAGLDPDQRMSLRSVITQVARNATVLVSTHLTDEAAAISDQILVLDAGSSIFTGSPAQLAAVAAGQVWISPHPPGPNVRASWRMPDGQHRCLGAPPAEAQFVEPTPEDGYLLMVRTPRKPPNSVLH